MACHPHKGGQTELETISTVELGQRDSPQLCYRIVHSLPGRVRIRLDPFSAHRGEELAARIATHPVVRKTRWTGAARSLTVEFDASLSFTDLVNFVPSDAHFPSDGVHVPKHSLWRQFLLPAISLAAAFAGPGLGVRIAIGLCATPIGRRAARSVLTRRLTIDVLDATAVGLLLGIGDTLAAGLSVALIESGERIRQRASGRARRVLRGWMGADSRGVRVLRQGSEPRIGMEHVDAGEHVVVYAGETIPVDGQIVTGAGMVDNRTWTGEPIPRSVSAGTPVLAGSSVADGRIVIRVTATGEDTRAGRLAAALEDAIAANTKVYDRARRIADFFVAPMFLLSGLTFAFSGQLGRAISILIVDFGTGVRIAIPTAVLTTMIGGARRGILFKNGQAVDDLAHVDAVVFDKTGTLTTGRPVVAGLVAERGFDRHQVLRLAASAEGHLPHPLAGAIRRAARRARLGLVPANSVRYLAGGLEAEVEGHRVVVGDARFLERLGIEGARAESAESSVALVAIDGVLAVRIRFRDTLKGSARSAIEGLRSLGISSLVLATGDHLPAARAVAGQLKLDRYEASLRPEDKVRLVEKLRTEGRYVAVVGDGINDAEAMAAANVGLAVPQGADMAREAADVVLLDEDLGGLVTAIRLARTANEIVRENVALVAMPNAMGLLLAMAGRLNPFTATVINNGSAMLAAANALRPLAGGSLLA